MSTSVEPRTVAILDPSDKFRPEKREERVFRNYTSNNAYHNRVRNTYYQMHAKQSVQFVKDKLAKWGKFDHAELTILEAVELMNKLVDESDPDVDIPNSVHAFQTAERIRELFPEEGWFQLTGLIHDIGKVLAVWGEPQYGVVGDTFVVGCEFSDKCVFGHQSFAGNPDFEHPVYSTKNGMYDEHCGLENIMISFGHDEYLYRVLKNHPTCYLPEEAMYVIRFHSFYPWHTSDAYMHLCNNKDLEMLKWVRCFNKFDLYSKADDMPDMEKLVPYYQALIDKYIPGKVKF